MVPVSDRYCLQIHLFCPDDGAMIMWQSVWVCKPTLYQLLCVVQERVTSAEFAWIRPGPELLAEYDLADLGQELADEHLVVDGKLPPANYVAKVYEGKLLMRCVARHRRWSNS